MSKSEIIKWLQNLKKDIGQSQHQDLWHYAEMLDEAIGSIEVCEDCISMAYLEQEIENQAMTVKKDEEYWQGWNNALGKVVELIEDAPSVAIERKRGEWVYVTVEEWQRTKRKYGHHCSICDEINKSGRSNYCLNCGADMRGGGAE